MQMKKNEKGITLIALAIMVVMIVIIASITVFSGTTSIQESKQKRIKIELETVQHAILENYAKYKVLNNEEYLIGTPITSENDEDIIDYKFKLVNSESAFKTDASKTDKYYKLEEGDYEKLGLTNVTFKYIVCYKTGEVMNIDVKTYLDGEPVYTKLD